VTENKLKTYHKWFNHHVNKKNNDEFLKALGENFKLQKEPCLDLLSLDTG
jgi:hypothetical protein